TALLMPVKSTVCAGTIRPDAGPLFRDNLPIRQPFVFHAGRFHRFHAITCPLLFPSERKPTFARNLRPKFTEHLESDVLQRRITHARRSGTDVPLVSGVIRTNNLNLSFSSKEHNSVPGLYRGECTTLSSNPRATLQSSFSTVRRSPPA